MTRYNITVDVDEDDFNLPLEEWEIQDNPEDLADVLQSALDNGETIVSFDDSELEMVVDALREYAERWEDRQDD